MQSGRYERTSTPTQPSDGTLVNPFPSPPPEEKCIRTVADLDANLRMLDLQITADQQKRRNIALVRQRVVSVVGENSRLTVAQAAAMAREMQKA